MILSRTSDDGTLGHWHMGQAELLLNAGHNEYPIPEHDLPSRIVREEWSLDPDEEGCPCSPDQLRAIDAEAGADGWATVVRLQAPVVEIARAFYELALQLDPSMDPTNYTPGGDDDTFDYWPSGMRLLYQLACDLDELTKDIDAEAATESNFRGAFNPNGDRYIERYRQVLAEAVKRNVPEMGGVVPEVPYGG